MNRLNSAYDNIKADAQVKETTLAYVMDKIQTGQKQPKTRVRSLRLVSAALCVVLLLVFSAGTYAFAFSPSSYISVDINPSVEITLNRLGKVISADSFNADGDKILEGLSLRWKPYDEALQLIVERADSQGFLTEDSWIDFSVLTSNETIYDKVSGFCRNRGYSGSCRKVSESEREAAHDLGLSCGKYKSYLELMEANPSYTLEDVKEMTMAEIHDLIDSNVDHIGDGSGNGYENGQGNGQSHGNGNSHVNGQSGGNGQGQNGHGSGHNK